MAGLTAYAPSAYLDAVLRFNTGALNFENRKESYGALQAYISSSPLLLSEQTVQTAKQSFERPVTIKVIKKMSISLIDGRACVVVGQQAATDSVSVTFSTKGFKIAVPTAMLDQNYITYQELLSHALYHGWHKWYDYMEGLAVAHLEANKASVLADVSQYFTNATGSYSGIQGKSFYGALGYAMEQNIKESAGFFDVESTNAKVTRNFMSSNGANNAVNDFSLIGGAQHFGSYKVVPGNGFAETHYLFTPGSVGVYYWVSPNAANGVIAVPDKDYWYTAKDPMFDYFTASVHYQQACADTANMNGSSAEPVYTDNWEFTIDPAFLSAYSSVEGESPIVKFNLVSDAI